MWHCAGVAARARVNAVNAASPASRTADDMLDMMLQQNQLTTESDLHIYQTPRRQQQLQMQVASV